MPRAASAVALQMQRHAQLASEYLSPPTAPPAPPPARRKQRVPPVPASIPAQFEAGTWMEAMGELPHELMGPSPVRLLRRFPCGARPAASSVLKQILTCLLVEPADERPWFFVLAFSCLPLRQPARSRGDRIQLARIVRERCQRLQRSRGHELVAVFVAAHQAAIGAVSTPPPSNDLRRRRRAIALAHVRAMRRAVTSLTAQPLAPDSPATGAALRALHPTVDNFLPPWLEAFAPTSPVALPLFQVAAALRSVSRLSSAGPAG